MPSLYVFTVYRHSTNEINHLNIVGGNSIGITTNIRLYMFEHGILRIETSLLFLLKMFELLKWFRKVLESKIHLRYILLFFLSSYAIPYCSLFCFALVSLLHMKQQIIARALRTSTGNFQQMDISGGLKSIKYFWMIYSNFWNNHQVVCSCSGLHRRWIEYGFSKLIARSILFC